MKLIKTSLISTFLMILCFKTYSQGNLYCGPGMNPPNPIPAWYTPNWDWLDNNTINPNNYDARIQGGNAYMGSPFVNNTTTTDMTHINDAGDYLREQGWVLLAKDFGIPYILNGPPPLDVGDATPWFMLYNKYRSVVRLFIYCANPYHGNPTQGSVILKWNNGNNSNSLLTPSNHYFKPNSYYSNQLTPNNEKMVNYLNQVPTLGGWNVTEFQVQFDPNTNVINNNFQRIDFDLIYTQTSDITMSGDFNFTTQSATAQETGNPTLNNSNANLLDYVVDAKNLLGKAPKKSELQAGFTQIANSVAGLSETFEGDFWDKLVFANISLQNGKFKDFLLGAADIAEGFGGGLGIAATVLEFFMGKSNSSAANSADSYIQPTISKGNLTLNGTIVASTNPKTISLQLPGTSHKYSDNTINCSGLPIYDCPLGVVSLQNPPTIEVRTWTEPEKTGHFDCSIDFQTPVQGCDPPPVQYNQIVLGVVQGANQYRRSTSCAATFANRTVKSYKVTGDIDLALNSSAEVTIESVKAALLFEIKDNGGSPAFDLYQSNVPNPSACCIPTNLLPTNCPFIWSGTNANAVYTNPQTTYVETTGYKNYAKDLLNSKLLDLSYKDVSGGGGYHKFQTPFIDASEFKNTAITIQDGVNVYLKLLIVMKPTNLSHDQTPIVSVSTYEIPASKFIAVGGSTPFTMNCAQQVNAAPITVGQPNSSIALINTYIGGPSIATEPNSCWVYAVPNNTTEFEAYHSIKLSPTFIAQPQTANSNIWIHLSPTAAGCAASTNALQVQSYFSSCTPSATDRIRNSKDSENKNALTQSELKMYIVPNPNNGTFILSFSENITEGIINITNELGVTVFEKDISDSNTLNIEANGLPKGIYIISVKSETNQIKPAKFIID